MFPHGPLALFLLLYLKLSSSTDDALVAGLSSSSAIKHPVAFVDVSAGWEKEN